MRTVGSLRVGVADAIDPREMQASSGTTASLLRALEGLVADAPALSGALAPRAARLARLMSLAPRLRAGDLANPRAATRRTHSAAQLGEPTIVARSLKIRRQLAHAGALDAVVQRGAEMRLPSSCRLVTLDDSTVLQGWRSYPWAHLQGLSDADVERYSERQRRGFEAAIACCCATRWVAESITGEYGIAPERVFTVGFGQNHEAPEPSPRDWSIPRYLFVGADWPRKNGPEVLAAFARIREEHPDARLDVVGRHPPIEQVGVVAHGSLSLVHEGDREQLARLYRECTAFVMPSLHEPAGIAYVEAGGAGMPSIGSSDGGAATMVGPGGMVVDPRRPEQIVQAMLTLANPGTAQRLGELAREHSRLFTWRKVAERMIRAIALDMPDLDTTGLADFL